MADVGRLDGKVALISGGARGQGEAEARLFAAEGARVVLGDVREDDCARVAREIGSAARAVRLDVTNEADWAQAARAAVDDWGRLDVLVNNAGIVRAAPLETMRLEDYMAVVNVNQVGTFLGMRAVVPAMRASGGGSIVNIASNAGMEGIGTVMGYVASKWAVRGMTRAAAVELGQHGIRVNTVVPGAIDTPMIASPDFEEVDREAMFAEQPIPRVGRPEEVAQLVLFLASDESSFSTGADFVADGGGLAGHAPKTFDRD